ncbi:hypothetical protein DL98DRAFT_653574 [Cadophora sp. DSE1049]|nr:hypothetical protein DL98DRAFT_653574 [Cadophora sp. DSE1049]
MLSIAFSPSPTQSGSTSTTFPLTTNALTTLFTAPPECASQWVAFSLGDIYSPKSAFIQRIVEDTNIDVSSCYPPSTIERDQLYRSYRSLSYGPGIFPSGYTNAFSTFSPGGDGGEGKMSAACCFDSLCSGFKTHTTNTGAAYLVYSTGRYCTSEYTSATSALRLDQYGAHPMLVVPTPAAVGSGLAVLDAVTVVWERSDLKLFSGDARSVVGEEVLGLLTGEERSLAIAVGEVTSSVDGSGGAVETSKIVPSPTSKSEEGRLRGGRWLLVLEFVHVVLGLGV